MWSNQGTALSGRIKYLSQYQAVLSGIVDSHALSSGRNVSMKGKTQL